MRRLVARFGPACLLLLAACCAGQTPSAAAKPGASLYILNCAAQLQRVDLGSGRAAAPITLAMPSLPKGKVHNDADAAVDGCATYGAVADGEVLYTLAPVPGTETEDGRHFRLLGFALPTLRQTSSLDLDRVFPDGLFREGAEPILRAGAGGAMLLSGHGKLMRWSGGGFVPGGEDPTILPGSSVDADGKAMLNPGVYALAGLQDPGRPVPYDTLESSGTQVLIRLVFSNGFEYGVADTQNKRLVRLQVPFGTTEQGVHLAPGGRTVVAQQGSYGKIAGVTYPGAKLAVLDAASGRLLRVAQPAGLKAQYTLTVTPTGRLLTYANQKTMLLGIGPVAVEPRASVQSFTHPGGPWFFVGQATTGR